ncbi:MAG: hypothetical protein KF861_05225 [Planctomycetaceae bacterium]|nr:hypothetical protein [Planctomycetaceae bacterium]
MTPDASDKTLPADVRDVLNALRGRIRRYVLIEGISLVVVVLAGLFWISYLTDWAYFRVSRLELPSGLRRAFFILMLCGLVGGGLTWIVARLLRRLRSRALALVLERRFPELDDRLITAVEFAENLDDGREPTPLRSAMQRRTMTDAARAAKDLDLAAVFDRRPLRRSLIAAILFVASIAGLGIADAASVQRWYSAFVLGRENYWDPFRRSAMSVSIVSQPGDQLKRLSTEDVFRHPRGADLVVRVDVPDDKLVPDVVTLHYRTLGETGESRGRVTMTQVGDRTFRHVLTRAMDDHQLQVVGGDFTNRLPFRIQIVDPPRVDAIRLECEYPAYTGMNAFADHLVPVQGTQVSLPVGTSCVLHAEFNKPLTGVRMRCPLFDLTFGRTEDLSSQAAVHADAASTPRINRVNILSADASESAVRSLSLPHADQWLSNDGLAMAIPVVIATDAAEALTAWNGASNLPLPVPPDVPLQFELHDTDDIRSTEPIRLTINGMEDMPPIVETRLKGIGRSITRLARIPIAGQIMDDYGVAAASFGHRIDGQSEYARTELAVGPSGQKQFALGDARVGAVERFNVLPLELSLGQKLILTVFARDADDVSGPHESHGEVYSFTVVSNEDLLAILYDKELNLRQRFEQIISEVQEARDDLVAQHRLSLEARALRNKSQPTEADEAQRDDISASLSAAADRRLNSLRKNHTETRAIEELFADIREELVNNRVDTSTMLARIDGGILTPLHQINEIDYPQADQSIALFRLVHSQKGEPSGEIHTAIRDLDVMLERMAGVLNEMRRRETFNELVKRLQSIRDKQEEIRNLTRDAKFRSLFDTIPDP